MSHLVFVYGTLKKGFHNHGLLEESEYEGPGKVPGHLYVVGLPYYKKADDGVVYGELYRVDDNTLARLDRLEGYNEHNPERSFYNRIEVDTAIGDNEGYYIEGYDKAFVYEYNGVVHEDARVKEGVYNG